MFKSASAWLRCITHLDRNTNLKCKNISLAAKKEEMAPFTASRHKRWTVTIQAFCSPRFFSFYTPSPWHCPPRTSGEAHRRGSWREQAWSITSLAKRTCLCHQEQQGAWAQVCNSRSSELTGGEWPVQDRQNDKEDKSCGRCLSAGKPEGMNTPVMHLDFKKLVFKISLYSLHFFIRN